MNSRVPNSISSPIKKLAEHLCFTTEPLFIQRRPESYAKPMECFDNVRAKIQRDGGKEVVGWSYCVWPEVFLEAEFHAVWETSAGELVDITPSPLPGDQTLFQIDANRVYEGKRLNNVRVALGSNPLISDWIEVNDAIYAIKDKGDRASKREITLSKIEITDLKWLDAQNEMLKEMIQRGRHPNSPCCCGNARQFRKCCASGFRGIINAIKARSLRI